MKKRDITNFSAGTFSENQIQKQIQYLTNNLDADLSI